MGINRWCQQNDSLVNGYSQVLTAANMVCMVVICLLPYCVNSTVEWKLLSHASTFPVFCLGILVIIYTLALFVILHCFNHPSSNFTVSGASYNRTWRSLFLQFVTAFLLITFAIFTDGSWSIDIIIFVSPIPTLLHTPVLHLWEVLRDGGALPERWTMGGLSLDDLIDGGHAAEAGGGGSSSARRDPQPSWFDRSASG